MPSRRTRDPEDVSISWDIDAYRFELPMVASAMDGVMSPDTCVAVGRLGGLGVLDLEGLWTRYDDPEPLLAEIAAAHGATPAQVALAWLLAQPVVTSPIVGVTKPEHLTDAVAAVDLELTDDELAQLSADYVPHAIAGHR